MINIVLNMPELYALAAEEALRKSGEFRCNPVSRCEPEKVLQTCQDCRADIVLMHVSLASGFTVNERKALLPLLRAQNNKMKLALIGEPKISEHIERFLMVSTQARLVDNFYYWSNEPDYLAQSLESLYP
ncbi:MAG: hypothetical protein IJV64_11745 [Oscillospiraceae bacterium]|nr:hypothetical protein [Oscillospiraceae bacterium]